jgi:hypothetical protein
LDGAFALIFERCDQLMFILAPQHPHVPGPVEKHGTQVFGARRRSVAWLLAATLRLRTERRQRADRENNTDRDTCPNGSFLDAERKPDRAQPGETP